MIKNSWKKIQQKWLSEILENDETLEVSLGEDDITTKIRKLEKDTSCLKNRPVLDSWSCYDR